MKKVLPRPNRLRKGPPGASLIDRSDVLAYSLRQGQFISRIKAGSFVFPNTHPTVQIHLREDTQIMAERNIHITQFDMDRLVELIDGLRLSSKANQANLDLLEKELYRAVVVDSKDIPQDVVTMNSKVGITDTESGEAMTYTLVFPSAANISENKLSILAPLGMALLGYRRGDIIQWPVPSGVRKVRVDEIIYQPEAAGDYHL